MLRQILSILPNTTREIFSNSENVIPRVVSGCRRLRRASWRSAVPLFDDMPNTPIIALGETGPDE